MDVGDGSKVYFWHDTWVLNRPLFDRFSSREVANMHFLESDKVEDFIEDGCVHWPPEILEKWPELGGKVIRINANKKDSAVWVSRDGSMGSFDSSKSWNDFREIHPLIHWNHLVWFSNLIPKHSFILWLAIRRKLMTQDRMQMWQMDGNVNCPFCHDQKDSVDHLFFECGFCREVLRYFIRKGVSIPEGIRWDEVVLFAANRWIGKSIGAIVNKLVLGSLIYFIWQERSVRLFQSQQRSLCQVIELVEEAVRFKILGLKVKRNRRVLHILEVWNISTELNSIQNGE